MIHIIAAVTANGAIGKDNNLLYYISEDLKRFKQLTTGNTVVMGRRTFESLPKGALPNRLNIVLTHNPLFKASEAIVATSVADALAASRGEVYIIGGKTIYEEFIDKAHTLRLTEIDAYRPDADTFFPTIDKKRWREVEATEWKNDEKSGVAYRFVDYRRVKEK